MVPQASRYCTTSEDYKINLRIQLRCIIPHFFIYRLLSTPSIQNTFFFGRESVQAITKTIYKKSSCYAQARLSPFQRLESTTVLLLTSLALSPSNGLYSTGSVFFLPFQISSHVWFYLWPLSLRMCIPVLAWPGISSSGGPQCPFHYLVFHFQDYSDADLYQSIET